MQSARCGEAALVIPKIHPLARGGRPGIETQNTLTCSSSGCGELGIETQNYSIPLVI